MVCNFGAILAPSSVGGSRRLNRASAAGVKAWDKYGVTPMLAEIFMLRVEAVARVAAKEAAASSRFVPITLPAPVAKTS